MSVSGEKLTICEIVERGRQNDPASFAAIVTEYRSQVRAVAMRTGLRACEVDDVEQETWCKMLSNLGALRQPECLGAWLRKIARNASLSLAEEKGRKVAWLPDDYEGDAAEDDPCGDAVVFREQQLVAIELLSRLGDRDRLLMSMLSHRASYREISNLLDMPVGSIGPTRERILLRLARCREIRRMDCMAA